VPSRRLRVGRIQKTRGPADRLADDLRWYFCNSESELGLRSSFGAFVDLSMSGVQPGGRSNGAEDRAVAIVDRLHKPTEAHRSVRRRVQALGARSPRLVDVLFAAYGPTDWGRVADAAFGRGTGERLAKALGSDRVGVALLTERLARAHAEWPTPPAGRPPTPGMVLRAMVVVAYPNQLPKGAAQRRAQVEALRRVNAIRDEATILLQQARTELPEVERRAPASPAPQAFVPPALRRRARPVMAYEALVTVVDCAAPSRAAAARWM
jgi:hypothetical protein